MKNRTVTLIVLGGAILLGAAIPIFLVWNPGQWAWADNAIASLRAGTEAPAKTAKKQLWTCGMHPEVIRDEPGNCPICQMRLTPVKDTSEHDHSAEMDPSMDMSGESGAAAPVSGSSGERKIKYWRAPMDPNFISDKPGKSPMGMDLVPVYEDEASTEGGVRVDPNFLQNFAVRTATVETGTIPVDIRTVGMLSHNPQRLYTVSVKFDGWIEKSYFNNVGEFVRKGQPIFEIYSPQLVTTQQEYLAALTYSERLSKSGTRDAVTQARNLLESSKERLRFWDISDAQIEELKRSRKVTRTLTIVSPFSGLIVEKMVESIEGMKVNPGMPVYKLADHSRLWTEVEIYEYHLAYLRLGQTAKITVDAFPGRMWTGKVVLLDSSVNPQTRTLKAYVEVINNDLALRPQMYGNVVIEPAAVRGVVRVPQQAVIHSGERSVVIVQKGKGLFEPREVELGATGGGYQEVLKGLRAGETLVTSSQFLIDSESNLKAAISQLLGSQKQDATGKGEAPKPAAEIAPAHQH